MHKLSIVFLLTGLVFFGSCKKTKNIDAAKEFTFNFQSGLEGWEGDFADYPSAADQQAMYQLQFAHAMLPSPLNNNDGAIRQSGTNRSDDLFMFVRKKINGIEPNKVYSISIEIEIATNAASGRVGVGGPPGESVYIKAGASTTQPLKMVSGIDNYYRLNIDKGNQRVGGADVSLIGNFANGTNLDVYKLKQLSSTSPLTVQSNNNGEIWLIVGTDSGFEATTTIYYNTIKARFN